MTIYEQTRRVLLMYGFFKINCQIVNLNLWKILYDILRNQQSSTTNISLRVKTCEGVAKTYRVSFQRPRETFFNATVTEVSHVILFVVF